MLGILILSLCGCGLDVRQSCSIMPFSSHVTFSFAKEDYEAKLDYTSADEIELSFSKPKSLRGLTLHSKDGRLSMSFVGAAVQIDDLAQLPLPETVPVQLLRLLSAVGQQTLTADRDGTVTGVIGDLTYEMLVDLQNGTPRRIATDDIVCLFGNNERTSA